MDSNNSSDESVSDINITPLVDVSLVMVIIFMVTAPFFVDPNIKITVPEATSGESSDKENVTITISAEGKWAVNETHIMPDKISALLQRKIDESTLKRVSIRADQQALHGALLYAMEVSKKCGASKISIAVKPRKK